MKPAPSARQRTAILRRHAQAIFRAGLAAADPAAAVARFLAVKRGRVTIAGKMIPEGVNRIRVVAFGKGACAMAASASAILPPRLFRETGLVVTSRGNAREVPRFQVLEAGHPLPDADGVLAARAVLKEARGLGERDLLLLLVSGGASALLPAPVPGITLRDKVAATRLLLASGADIRELNTVRKHLSTLKGGGLARAAAPGHVRALLLSDVLGDDPSVIASGPVSPDPSTYADALAVLRKRGILARLPRSVSERIESGAQGEFEETPKPGDPIFDRVECSLIGSNAMSVAACHRKAEALGYLPHTHDYAVRWDTWTSGGKLAKEIGVALERFPHAERIALLSGGEPTVKVTGSGRGGRNQELALVVAIRLAGSDREREWDWAFLSGGTDGIDGPTDAAGGLVDAGSLARLSAAEIDAGDAMRRNDSHTALAASGDLLVTGPTGTNVADLQITLIWRRAQLP